MVRSVCCRPAYQTGFTLVELITVLALISIVSAVAISRLGNISSYENAVFRDRVLSYLRLSQNVALAHHGEATSIQLTRTTDALWDLVVTTGAENQTYEVESESDLSVRYTGITVAIGVGESFTLSYSQLGDLTGIQIGVNPVTALNTSIELTTGGGALLCVSPVGLAYVGACR